MLEIIGSTFGALMFTSAFPLATNWPSGFVTIMKRPPVAASGGMVRFKVMLVALLKLIEFTVTSAPSDAAMCFGNDEAGSKKPLPPLALPATVTLVVVPRKRMLGEHAIGAAGGGALN